MNDCNAAEWPREENSRVFRAGNIVLNHINFADLHLSERLLRALDAMSYQQPTPIQQQAIPAMLAGSDILGIAQTGTGKTAAFTLPLLQKLEQDRQKLLPGQVRALILAPTRELAVQISEAVSSYGKHMNLRSGIVMGGVGQRGQVNKLKRGVDILIATPGRLIDLQEQGHVDFSVCHNLIVDEADRMLDMGFIRDIRKIVALLPAERQTLMFSATMPREVDALAAKILNKPQRIEIAKANVSIDRIDQKVVHLEGPEKRSHLTDLLQQQNFSRVIVFTRTKRGAERVVKHLAGDGIEATALHGNKSQAARQKALAAFKSGQMRVLVATDIASRGIDVDDVSHVINYELPDTPESYVHRIGRTARAGASGVAISFCDSSDRSNLRAIEKFTKLALPSTGTPVRELAANTNERASTPGRKKQGTPRKRWRNRRNTNQAA
jgi:ATP-dependent RNA helicase RhlE